MMKNMKLGTQGLNVPVVGLGCMGMSEFYGVSNEKENLFLLDKAFEMGCVFWDTADMYGPFTNEKLLGAALKGRREKITLATKFGNMRGEAGEWLGISGHPDYVRASCEASLTRLKTDYIDLYYQHRMDPEVPIEDTVGAMSELVKEGKVKYIGLSEADPETIERAHKIHPISALQTEYSLWSRDVEVEILPTCNRLGIGFVAYSPLGRGFLTGKIADRASLDESDWRLTNPRFQKDAFDHNLKLVQKITEVSKAHQVTTAQVALAWILGQKPEIAMIPGTRHLTYLQQNLDAINIGLRPEDIDELTKFSAQFITFGDRY